LAADVRDLGSGVSVIGELKRRNVVRVAVLYGLAAWLILQVADVLVPALGLPDWAMRFVALLLLLGFPLMLIFSWVYELTPEGLKKQHEVDRDQSITHETGRKINYLIGALAALAIVVVVIERFMPRNEPIPVATDAAPAAPTAPAAPLEETAAQTEAKSIAVLPFVNMSSDADNEYFSDGLSEELLNLLASIPDLRVAARTSAFQFKGEKIDVKDVAQKLNVAHILEGSVRKSGNKVRITAQLVNAADGYQLWSETYDRTLDDIFVVQDDIAGEVVKALQVTLLGTQLATRSRPVDSEAYNLALQGRFFLLRGHSDDFERAADYYRRSLERDPGYAPAWAGLSGAYAMQAFLGYVPAADGFRRAREAAEKALALDPQLADAHLAMAGIYRSYDWDWAAADASVRKALDLEPGKALAIGILGVQAAMVGRWSEAIDLANKAIERDPLWPNSYATLGYILLDVNRDTEAEAAFRKAVELDPAGTFWHGALGLALLLQGKADDALQEMQQETDEASRLTGLALAHHELGRRGESDAALAALKSKYAGMAAYQIAEVHAFRGEDDLAFEWLERAYAQRDSGVILIKGDPLLRGLVRDPRYKAFLRKLKLPE
jgi:TolB-like protein/Tfp pilus assembly protein PilF